MAKSKDETRRRYGGEPLATAVIIEKLKPYFDLWLQVDAIGADGDGFKIDMVARCLETGWFFGVEVKRSHLFKSEFANGLRQAIYYRLARITDPALVELGLSRLPAVALFPDWLGEHDDDTSDFSAEAVGMRLLAGQFRVGTLREVGDRISFIMHQTGIWHSNSGWTKTAEGVLFGKRPIGAMRKKDR